MAKLLKTHVKPSAVQILLFALAAIVSFNILARFNLLPVVIADNTMNILTLFGALFILTEVAVMSVLRNVSKGKINVLDVLISLVGIFAILGVVLSWAGISVSFLEYTQAWTDIGLLLFILVEIFR